MQSKGHASTMATVSSEVIRPITRCPSTLFKVRAVGGEVNHIRDYRNTSINSVALVQPPLAGELGEREVRRK
jgi:hypothetical protein